MHCIVRTSHGIITTYITSVGGALEANCSQPENVSLAQAQIVHVLIVLLSILCTLVA